MIMMWMLTWLNVSAAALNATFQLLVIYRLDRSKMDLVFQETFCSSQVLKTWRLIQETSEEKLLINSRQIAWQLAAVVTQDWFDDSIWDTIYLYEG